MNESRLDWWPPTEGSSAATDVVGGPQPPEPPRRTRGRAGERARAAQERKSARRRALVAIVVAGAMLIGAAYVVFAVFVNKDDGDGGQVQNAPDVEDYPGPGFPSAQVVINNGDTGAAMAATLVAAGVVATEGAFIDAFAANSDASKIQPGTYNLLLQMKASDAVLALLNPASRVSMKLTIPEGLKLSDIVTRINEVTLIPVPELEAALADPASFGLPAEANGNAEGWLFPSTYQVEPGATATSVLTTMSQQMVKVLTDHGVAQADWLSVVTKASLVESEAGRDEDRPRIARVIENRLDEGWALEIDATIAYGLDKPGTQLTDADLADASNPYNTRKHTGLPPTPITAPGVASIEAVLQPDEGPWMFWVTVNLETKETKFATTLAEHNQYVAEMLAWMQDHATPAPTS